MSTTSTIPTIVPGLVTAYNTAFAADADVVDVKAHEAWPGPDATAEMVVFGAITWDDYAIATIKAGRKQRQENYSIAFEVWVQETVEGTSPAVPGPARARAFEILAKLEDIHADDARAGFAHTVVQWIEVRPGEAGPRVMENGWAYRIAGSLAVHARLT